MAFWPFWKGENANPLISSGQGTTSVGRFTIAQMKKVATANNKATNRVDIRIFPGVQKKIGRGRQTARMLLLRPMSVNRSNRNIFSLSRALKTLEMARIFPARTKDMQRTKKAHFKEFRTE
jgi:hypothetical protein